MEEAYRLGEQLLVLSRGRITAFGAKEEIFRHPPNAEVARLTGCKNISRARVNLDGTVEALDWDCRVRVPAASGKTPKYIGIRAHHVDFLDSSGSWTQRKMLFSAGSFELRKRRFASHYFSACAAEADTYHLQAEVYKEKWRRFRDLPFPWRVQLAPESLFLMPD